MPSRRNRRNRNQRNNRRSRRSGGALVLSPGDANFGNGLGASSEQSLLQGSGFQNAHKLQHGGVAPVDYVSTLDPELRGAARLSAQDASYSDIAGMSDQAGGRRRRRRSRKARSKRSRKHASRKHRSKRSNRSRRLRGGSHLNMAPLNGDADLSSSYGGSGGPGMLLKDYSAAGLNADFRDFKSVLPK